MPLFSDQQTTHLQKFSNASTAPILRASADYAPAPSSGNSLSELATHNDRNSNNNYVSRSTASLVSPRPNPSIMRSVSIDSDAILPITQSNIKNNINDQAPQKPKRSVVMRAAESGKGTLLPMRGAPASLFRQQRTKREAPGRSNSSGPSYSAGLPRTRQDLGDSNAHPQKSGGKSKVAYLRRRNANASSDDEFDSSSQRIRRDNKNIEGNIQNDAYFHSRSSGSRRQRHSGAMSVSSTGSVGTTNTSNNGSSSREHNGSPRWVNGILCQHQLIRLSRMKLGHLLQVVIVLAVIALVYESHHKALLATEQLNKFKNEESLLLLHLQKIELQSIQLHEIVSRLGRVGIGGINSGGNSGDEEIDPDGGRDVDFGLIHQQTQQLIQMEQELSHEVETLQKRIQLSARKHLIQEFGEGPVQVVLDLDFGNAVANTGPNRITIKLWIDTPHAAWTWLEQIGNNVWDGAEFKWQQGHIIDAFPPENRVDPERDGKIEFIEHSHQAITERTREHEAWTVGVREQTNNANSSGRGAMSMFINLQDNSQLHKHETCVGKVIDGFDVLQKLLELSRSNGNGDQQDKSSSTLPITIRKATAEHFVTIKGGMGK